MVNPASAQADVAVGTLDPGSHTQSTVPPAPPGGETAAEAAEPPGERVSLWRRVRRSRLGVAALLPVLLLAAVYVAAPFAGTGQQPVDQPGPSAAAPYPGAGR